MEFNKATEKCHKRIVVKVGSSTLTHDSGKLNLRMMDKIAMILSDIKNDGLDVVLVTSAAVAAGVSKLGLKERPKTTKEKQAENYKRKASSCFCWSMRAYVCL